MDGTTPAYENTFMSRLDEYKEAPGEHSAPISDLYAKSSDVTLSDSLSL